MEEQDFYESIGQALPAAEKSQMFGKPCFKINGKAFMSFFQKECVFKLSGDARETALSLPGAHVFDPSGKGRPMKEWVQVPYEYTDRWPELAKEAFEYVRSNNF